MVKMSKTPDAAKKTIKYPKTTFVLRLLLVLLTAALLLASFNIYIDGLGLFARDMSGQKTEPNQQFIKMRYILNNSDKYDTFVFGASRIGTMDVSKVSPQMYNMTYSQALPAEMLANIRDMLDAGVTVSAIYLGLDEFSFRLEPEDHRSELSRRPYSTNVFVQTAYYLEYLLTPPKYDYMAYRFGLTDSTAIYDVYGTGCVLNPAADAAVEAAPDAHAQDPRFENISVHTNDRFDKTVSEVAEICELCSEHGINLTVFFNPTYYETREANNPARFEEFKYAVAQYTEVYDFAIDSTVTHDRYNYYESSHYRTNVGDMILTVLTGTPISEIPDGMYRVISKGSKV